MTPDIDDTAHRQNMKVAMDWAAQTWTALKEDYARISDEERARYVAELTTALSGVSLGADYVIKGDDNLNVNTFWVYLHGEMFPNGVPDTDVDAVSVAIDTPLWQSIDIEGRGTNLVSFACVPSLLLSGSGVTDDQ